MAFLRASTELSMVSRGWSTAEFFDGLAKVAEGSQDLQDLVDLPDDLDALEDLVLGVIANVCSLWLT